MTREIHTKAREISPEDAIILAARAALQADKTFNQQGVHLSTGEMAFLTEVMLMFIKATLVVEPETEK